MKKNNIVKINGLRWLVKTVKDSEELDNDTLALTKFDNLVITIKEDLNPAVFKRTLRHELTHAFAFSYGLNLEAFDEESICNFVETYGEKICLLTDILFGEKKLLKET